MEGRWRLFGEPVQQDSNVLSLKGGPGTFGGFGCRSFYVMSVSLCLCPTPCEMCAVVRCIGHPEPPLPEECEVPGLPPVPPPRRREERLRHGLRRRAAWACVPAGRPQVRSLKPDIVIRIHRTTDRIEDPYKRGGAPARRRWRWRCPGWWVVHVRLVVHKVVRIAAVNPANHRLRAVRAGAAGRAGQPPHVSHAARPQRVAPRRRPRRGRRAQSR